MVTEVEYFDLVAIEQCYGDILIAIKQLWFHFGHRPFPFSIIDSFHFQSLTLSIFGHHQIVTIDFITIKKKKINFDC
jgi:hypothetical protein